MARNVVGARELKTRLGTYLQQVREGRTLVVTDRGEPVAELRPLPSDGSLPSALLKLSMKGSRLSDPFVVAEHLSPTPSARIERTGSDSLFRRQRLGKALCAGSWQRWRSSTDQDRTHRD